MKNDDDSCARIQTDPPVDSLTASTVSEIRQRADAATKGPWRISMSGYAVKSTDDEMPVVAAVPGGAQTYFFHVGNTAKAEGWLSNAEFIAHAREDVPLLLDHLAALQQQVAALTQERDKLQAERNDLHRHIDLFWQYVENGYDIEPRAYFEQAAPENGFDSPLAQAAHHIWKRDPKVEVATAALAQLREGLQTLERWNLTTDRGLREPDLYVVRWDDLTALLAATDGST